MIYYFFINFFYKFIIFLKNFADSPLRGSSNIYSLYIINNRANKKILFKYYSLFCLGYIYKLVFYYLKTINWSWHNIIMPNFYGLYPIILSYNYYFREYVGDTIQFLILFKIRSFIITYNLSRIQSVGDTIQFSIQNKI